MACAALSVAGEIRAQSSSRFDASAFLGANCGFSSQDVARLARREVIARTLKAEGDEVAICAAATLAVPPAFYVDRFRQIESFKKSEEVKGVGRLFAGAKGADLRALTLDDGDAEDLRECRPRNCDVKLDAEGLARIATGATRDPEAEARSIAAFRDHLAAYATRYLREGDRALMAYVDSNRPRSVAAALQTLMAAMPFLAREMPRLHSALASFDGSPPPGVEHFLYWSNESFGRKPVISITHALIVEPRPGLTAIATKQIYASHYFNASLGVTLVGQSGAGTTVIYINRSQVDAFGGVLGRVARALVRSRARSGAERMLEALRDRLERDYSRPR